MYYSSGNYEAFSRSASRCRVIEIRVWDDLGMLKCDS